MFSPSPGLAPVASRVALTVAASCGISAVASSGVCCQRGSTWGARGRVVGGGRKLREISDYNGN